MLCRCVNSLKNLLYEVAQISPPVAPIVCAIGLNIVVIDAATLQTTMKLTGIAYEKIFFADVDVISRYG